MPSAFAGDGEEGSLVDGVSIGFNKDTVSVVEGGPEIVKRIAQDRGGMPREPRADGGAAFPHLTVAVGAESLFVLTDVASENLFELADVMFGPFGL
jgi:hypothetical protein